ncbi:MAG: hypothetical protein U1E83_00855 [Methylotetracoccus sp.]
MRQTMIAILLGVLFAVSGCASSGGAAASESNARRTSDKSPSDDPVGQTPPEYEDSNRWGLTGEGSQRKDWLEDR